MQVKTFVNYYYRQIRIAYSVMVFLTILISFLDIYTGSLMNRAVEIINLVTVVLLFLTLLMIYVFKLDLELSTTIGIYVIFANLILSYLFAEPGDEQVLNFLFRETIFLLLIMILAGLLLRKFHIYIILAYLLFRYIHLAIVAGPPFLADNLLTFIGTFIAIAFVIYYLSEKLHTSNAEIQRNEAEILDKNEDLALKNKRLLDMNTAKDQFFSVLSHDLRSPVSALLGFTDLLIEKEASIDEKKRKFYVENIKKSAETMDKLLNNLLEWSRSQSNQIRYEPEKFSLKDLAENVCYYLKHSADLKGVVLINSVDEKHMVYADFNMVFTVLRNLISNAIKFSTMSKPVVIGSEDLGKMVKVIVVDEGTGMEPEVVDSLFKIDKTFSRPGTNDEKGTGLGLIICNEFVEKNKGSMGVESVEGKGSIFWFTIPKQREKGK
jgi:signal transduction histidine kinase